VFAAVSAAAAGAVSLQVAYSRPTTIAAQRRERGRPLARCARPPSTRQLCVDALVAAARSQTSSFPAPQQQQQYQ